MVRVRTDEIVYVKADGNYCELVLTNGSSQKMTFQLHCFEDSFQQLRNNTFVRVGRSLIVNKLYIYIINLTEQILILNGKSMKEQIILRGSDLPRNPRNIQLSRDSLKQLMNLLLTEKGDNDHE